MFLEDGATVMLQKLQQINKDLDMLENTWGITMKSLLFISLNSKKARNSSTIKNLS